MKTFDCRGGISPIETLLARRVEESETVANRVREILADVKREGERAVIAYARELDTPGIDAADLPVSREEMQAAVRRVSPGFRRALGEAARNIRRYHKRQMLRSWSMRGKGIHLEQRVLPLRRVGLYVPGGTAAYPSTVLMNAIPAKVAGVQEIAMITPAGRDGRIKPEVLAAAAECGVTEIYRVGGAHGIAALAYGTPSIPPVDKITGPGNAYVATAKRLLFGEVGIDMIAGPTEVVIVADGGANPRFLAADMIAQAEHDPRASAILFTTVPELIESVRREVEIQVMSAPRGSIARESLDRFGGLVLVGTLDQAAEGVNRLAPEHLEVVVKNPRPFVRKIRNAGAIFVGEWSTEALGDYVAGPNHTLPTLGTARFSSALSVHDFLKFTNIITAGRDGFRRLAPSAEILADAEGLHGHASSVRVRREAR